MRLYVSNFLYLGPGLVCFNFFPFHDSTGSCLAPSHRIVWFALIALPSMSFSALNIALLVVVYCHRLQGRAKAVEAELVTLREQRVQTSEGTRAMALELCYWNSAMQQAQGNANSAQVTWEAEGKCANLRNKPQVQRTEQIPVSSYGCSKERQL